jgi:predicted nucleic acid-binding protein
MTVVVADSGPLIALAKIEALHLLRDLYRQVITGPTVYTEAVTAGLAMNAADAIALQEAFQRGELAVRTPSAVSLSQPGLLHEGEAESICLAIELKADWLLMDDLSARQIAQRNLAAANLSTGMKGTLGVIVTAAHNHVIAPAQAIELVQGLKGRPDVWLAPALCEAVVKALQRLS